MKRFAARLISPAGVTCILLMLVVGVDLLKAEGDALKLARIGTRFSQGLVDGSEGYDGQFVYFIARNPAPDTVKEHLDVPAYRYQRILFPIIGRGISLGQDRLIPWALLFIGIAAQTAGTWFVSKLLVGVGTNRWYALSYGLWPGLVASVRVMLPEPLAFAFIAAAIYFHENGKWRLSIVFYSLALFTKEVTLFFVVGQLACDLMRRKWRRALELLLLTVLPFILFQWWILGVFGQIGIGSGGANATSFEYIPFMGLLRILPLNSTIFFVYLLLYLPFLFVPLGWGLMAGYKKAITFGEKHLFVWVLLANLVVIPFLPFSTYREPGGMLRFLSAGSLALLLFAARYKYSRALNYSPFWIALNFVLLY